ncbi:gliding motility-associated-like protein [Maribacter vaceletii]|uniref:Gliding motility-associated-like protein n=1 Tax=Maribacter vaceletii TaxID=1206816 RepID=A0A495ED59_9FLAO|nr:T9SS type B sorting domain-containing protein [Maribacter vaceletii]RKR14815.1 gliding motility-associated-like protein [Maribacter vaceletii]
MKAITFKKPNLLVLIIFLLTIGFSGFSQEYRSFTRDYGGGNTYRYQNNLKGDLTFISNNILNRDQGTATTTPNDAYNNQNVRVPNNQRPPDYYNAETGGFYNYNDFKNMQYIDVDTDASTFSSSSATFTFPDPNCNLIRYAGLYWSATYPSEIGGQTPGTNRRTDFNQIQFKVPNGNYVPVTGEILFDGFTNTQTRANSPYACYADVTSLITPLANPEGEYTIADVRATLGNGFTGGSAAGWTLVIVYENPTMSGKLITTFDGFARVTGTSSIPINYSGFTTIPAGSVKAQIGAGALEGDFSIGGDQMRIRAASSGGGFSLVREVSDKINPNNFFNSDITLDGDLTTNRNPNSSNTLGYDTDIFELRNLGNSVIPNNETAATFQFRTNGDQYYPFFNSFNIEIIEPEIVLEKKVEDIAGNDITGLGVNLGQVLDYVLSFQNIGNDHATGPISGDPNSHYTITDILPINVTLDESNFDLPTGVTYTYNPATRTVVFDIPDNLVNENDPIYSIRMRVRVAENCFDFIDACTDLIQNLAYSTYSGVINDNVISDDPSVTDFDNCGFTTPGATNFLLDDLSDCNFTRTVQLCGDDVVLDAGDNFDDYIWYRDENNNNQIDPGVDTVLNDGNPDNDLSTIIVTEAGFYMVDKIIPAPCKGFREYITVERFGDNTVNPIIDYFNTVNGDADATNDIQGEIVQCSVDGDMLPKIFLCGIADSELLQVNILDAQSIVWEQLNEGSCDPAGDDCANKNLTCTWSQVSTGNSYDVNTPGKYRLVVNYQNGCFNRFYFNVFQNTLDIEYTSNDVICTTPGNIRITSPNSGYGYQLINVSTTPNTVEIPFSANNGPNFSFTSNGAYRVEVVQLDNSGNPIPNACIFSTPEIGIRDRDFQVEITTTSANCNSNGSIDISVLNVEPDYTYVLRRSDGTIIDDETAQPDNTHSFDVVPGDYIVETSTGDGCFNSQNITVNRIPDPTLSAVTTQNIGCTAGTITLTPNGGFPNPSYGFAIWSKDGVDLYSDVSDIPADAYQTTTTFSFGWVTTIDEDGNETRTYTPGEDGSYEFILIDDNGCTAFSSATTILDNGTMSITSIDEVQPSCSGDANGSLTINISGGVGPFLYSIDDGVTTQGTATFAGLTAGTYNIRVTDSSGCDVSEPPYVLSEPFPFSASAGVSRDVSCDPSNGAEVRITNVVGGTPPYSFSFDGGATFSGSQTAILMPGTYNLIARDASCDFPMTIEVEGLPARPIVTLTPTVDYNCSGTGNITVTPDITTYNYTYELDGVLNTPDPTSNTFNDLPIGDYVITTNYVPQTPPTAAVLLVEDFGYGPTIPNANTSTALYYYESQLPDGIPSGSPRDGSGTNETQLNDYEYAVTSNIENPFTAWFSPVDHTTGDRSTEGRYLAINLGAVADGATIYQKEINDIIPNQDLNISLWAINLVRTIRDIGDPNLTIELRDPSTNTLVGSANTGFMPEEELWRQYEIALNPGAYTSLNLVITSTGSVINGSDVAIDDILVTQTPEICELSINTPISIEPGNAFASTATGSTNVSCNGLTDGTITFEVENFDATDGFDYSTDNWTTFTNSTSSPVTTAAVLGAGTQTVLIRRADDHSCEISVTRDITEPTPVVASASITEQFTCNNTGATITASATGGTPTYVYQLEDTSGNAIATYDYATNGNNTIFSGLAAGDYIVKATDLNTCEDAFDTVLTVVAPNNPTFTAEPILCYSGNSDGTIQVDVTSVPGNGGFQFSIEGNPWVTPNPATNTSYTFNNLSNGTYTIDVRDSFGCAAAQQTVTINRQVTVTASAENITACATSTDITITADGGDGNYVYALVANAATPAPGDFNPSNIITAPAIGDYDVYVRDKSGATDFCEAVFDINIAQDPALNITETLVHNLCFGDTNGSIALAVTGGEAPYEYSIDDGANYVTTATFNNLAAGIYPIRIKDANDCELANSFEITETDVLTAEAVLTQNYTCLVDGEITVGSVTATDGGSGDYQYSINGSSWTASTTGGHTFTGLTDGTYSIQVRDANATTCTLTLADIVIDPLPTEPTITTTLEYNCDGTANVNILPADATYTYSLGGSAYVSTNVFNNVAVGTYPISINYGRECTTDSNVTIENGNAFEAAIDAFTNLNCNTDGSGTITISANNFGTGGYEYSLDGAPFVGPFTTPETINSLAAGNYSIEVRDVTNAANVSPLTGCSITITQTLTEPAPVVASASITEEFTCNNTGATITASASGGTPTYVYQLEDNGGTPIVGYEFINNGNNTIFTGLAAGDYIVVARDINNCSDPIDTAINIAAPINPTFTAEGTACYSGANDGTIFVDITSLPGNGGFQFSLDGAPWVTPGTTSHTFTNLANGTYTVDVRDGYGCAATQQTVTLNDQLTATTILQPDLTCTADATITIDADGGSGTYIYEWSTTNAGPWNTTGFTANVYNTNTAGSYFFRITDTTAPTVCTFITNEVVVTPADTPVITSITPTNLNCNGDDSGALEIVIDTSVGLAPYSINVVNTTTGTVYGTQTSGLAAGTYEVTVTDAKGCFVTETETITEPNVINYTATSVPIQCDNTGTDPSNNTTPGEISISAITGGTAEYTYYLTANNGIPTQTYNTTPGNRDHTFTILSFGIYQIDIVDANGCAAFSTEIIASPPNDLDIDVSTSTANCADGGTAVVTVDAAVGSGSYEFAVLETYSPPYSTNYVNPDVPGGSTATFSSIANGIRLNPGVTYTFVVFDTTTKCYYFETSALPIDTPSNMTATLDAVNNVTCTGSADGNISFTFDNYDVGATAVGYEIFNLQSNISTGITGSSPVNPPTGARTVDNFATLAPGEYYLLLSEVGGAYPGCTVHGGNFTIRESVNLLDVTPVVTKNDNCNVNAGVITATGQFGTAPYEYQILPTGSTTPTVLTWAGTSNNTFNVEGGDYDVYVKDAYGCIQFNTINLPTDSTPEISLALVDECATEGNFEVVVTLDQAGVSPYRLSVNGAAYQNITFNGSNEYTVTGLSSGAAQTIEISDINGCGETENITIYPSYSASATPTKLLDCTASPNAEITISATGGSGSFTYEISGPVNQGLTALPSPANSTVWNLASAPGTYTVSIYDVNTPSCPATTFPVEIAPRLEPIFDTITPTDVTCNTANDGTITASVVNNGIGDYTFEITSLDGAAVSIAPTSTTATSATFTGLAPTTTAAGYIITVTADSATNNCPTNSTSIIVNEPIAMAVTLDPVVEFTCTPGNGNNQNSASITVASVTGGSTNYVRYEFFNDLDLVNPVQTGTSTTYTETNTAGGNYTINVYDDNGCLGTATATIEAYDELLTATTATSNDITCTPGSDGEVTITVTSSNSDATKYEFSIDGGTTYQPSNIFPGLGIGTHNFIIRHVDTGCILNASQIITDPNTFDIVVDKTSDVICFGTNTGAVNFSITDATYTDGFDYRVFEQVTNTPVTASVNHPNLGPTPTVNLGAGDYYVIITQDSNPDCENRADFSIAGPDATLSADRTVTEITCNPTNNGIIEIINPVGGWGGYEYLVFNTTAPPATGTSDAANYIGDPVFDNLSAGTYEVWIIDEEECTEQLTDVVLNNPTPIVAQLNVTQENCTNFDGVIEVTGTPSPNPVSGGQGNGYSYQLIKDGTPFGAEQTTTTFSGLGAGAYTVTVTDQWGCTLTTTTAVTLYEDIAPQTDIIKAIDCNSGGSIDVTQTGGEGSSYTYTITHIDGVPNVIAPTSSTATSASFTNLTQVGTYTFSITDNVTLCVKTIDRELVDIIYPEASVDASTNVTCNNDSDGTINVSVLDNGVGPYTFTIIDGDGATIGSPITPTSNTNTTAVFTGLRGTTPGITYTIRAMAFNGCTDDTQTATITQPDVITVPAPTAVSFNCTTGNVTNYPTITITGETGGSTNFVRYEFINTTTGTTVQNGTDNSYTETNFAGGNYTINVYDDNGCVGTTTTTIAAFDELQTVVPVATQIICSGTDIRIDATSSITNSTANPTNYEFREITSPASSFQGSNMFTGLDVGVHRFEARNISTGCIMQTEYIVEDPNTFTPEITILNNVVCNGTNSGQITLEVTDAVYTGNFEWEIFDTNNTPTNTGDDTSITSGTGMAPNTTTAPIALAAGNYRIRIAQETNPGCAAERFFSITEPEVIAPNASEQANPTCSNDQGSILVNPTGGEGPFTITLSNGTGYSNTQTNVSAFLFEGLAGGTYDIEITDTVGCIQNFPAEIILQTPEVIDASATATALTCFNENTATITASVAVRTFPATPVYEYQLNVYDASGTTITQTSVAQSNPTFTGLSAGTYSITVTDDFGCSDETPLQVIINPTEVSAQLIRTQALTCEDGVELQLSATGGLSGTYEYSIDNVTFTLMVGNTVNLPIPPTVLGAGTYQYYVRDANGCEAVLSNAITEDPIEDLILTIEPETSTFVNCNGDNTGNIFASATGGLGNYRYELYSAYNGSTLNPADLLAGPQNQGEFTGLTAGTYFVNVTSDDCTTEPQRVEITEPTILEVIDTNNFTDVTCNGEDDGTITVELQGGVGPYQYAISPNLNQFDSVNTFTDLAPGLYGVIAQDQNGCFEYLEYTISEPVVLTTTATTTPEICVGSEDGTITLTVDGGNGPYRTAINSNSEADFVQDRLDFTNLAAGNYLIFVRDVNNCETNIVVDVEPGVNLNATITPVYECSGDVPTNYVNITLEDSSVLGDVLYAIDSTNPNDMQLNPDFRNSTPGTHYIAIAHTNGCVQTFNFVIEDYQPLVLSLEQRNLNEITAIATGGKEEYTFIMGDRDNGTDNTFRINRTDTYTVTVIDENGCESVANIYMEFIDIDIPNVFTPDGDGLNDTWFPKNQEAFPEILTIIFDRYGREVYRMGVNDNPWDGLYQQTELPTGDYWYVIKLRGEEDDREFVGHFTLYR